ncbi:alpha/beta fold hydrolase [Flavilitoribacter nigricans]|uniref:AB hydrolase-1 domain-containing protein n=1 Tax=Flavilitoribacter nigricans (strain ATCC 23147 / DSM 23189 / NBRC 102662 / NCIMB 1420 / SS-2) TaxID=1122177 RepID=A0A2D0N1X3_FLAN2|nr:alpha/beta fold hydrolase [Flavilitoribacter nigricans]PHN02457.1 hypothetical protein CRP01_32260 [Flavilitoribacter nigricans DSM 23189 = NBRC 102662]
MRSLMLSLNVLFLLPVFAQTGYLKESPQLAYWELGRRSEVVIILHGGPGVEHTYLRPEFDVLKRSARIIYYDQRGCGRSKAGSRYLWQDHMSDLKRMIREHAPGQKVFLAGSSWGSLLALLYAYHYPEDIKGLILSGLVPWMGKGKDIRDRPYLQHRDPEEQPDPVIRKFPLQEHKWVEAIAENGDLVRRKVPIEKEVYAFRGPIRSHTVVSMESAPVMDSLHRIQLPALILNGSDPCRYLSAVNEYALVLPQSEIVYFDGACHDPWFSDPQKFRQVGNAFIRRVKKQSRKAGRLSRK